MARPLLLLVDDVPEIGMIVQRLGKWAEQDVVHCLDAETAWKRVSSGEYPPDLVILDLNLPGMSGVDWCRKLRAEPTIAALPIALFSHWERPADIVRGLEAGADTVLSKDLLCSAADWRQRVGEILDDLNGRSRRSSLDWEGAAGCPPSVEGAALLEEALGHATVRRLGADVVRVLIERVMRRIGLASKLTPTNGRTASEPAEVVARGLGFADVPKFVLVLAEEIRLILGTAASAAYRTALAQCAPSLWRMPADR